MKQIEDFDLGDFLALPLQLLSRLGHSRSAQPQ